jgi:hypothetical protein
MILRRKDRNLLLGNPGLRPGSGASSMLRSASVLTYHPHERQRGRALELFLSRRISRIGPVLKEKARGGLKTLTKTLVSK